MEIMDFLKKKGLKEIMIKLYFNKLRDIKTFKMNNMFLHLDMIILEFEQNSIIDER